MEKLLGSGKEKESKARKPKLGAFYYCRGVGLNYLVMAVGIDAPLKKYRFRLMVSTGRFDIFGNRKMKIGDEERSDEKGCVAPSTRSSLLCWSMSG